MDKKEKRDLKIAYIAGIGGTAFYITIILFFNLPRNEFVVMINDLSYRLAVFFIETFFLFGTAAFGYILQEKIPSNFHRIKFVLNATLFLYIGYCAFVIKHHYYDGVFEPNLLHHPYGKQIFYVVILILTVIIYLLVKKGIVKDDLFVDKDKNGRSN